MRGKLTALKVQRTSKPGRYGDGGNLWLHVRPDGRKSWQFRFALAGLAREMGLGGLDDVTLAEARDATAGMRKLVRLGIDPIEHRRRARAEAMRGTGVGFREAAALYISAHEAAWRSAKHRQQWANTLGTYAMPILGDRAVAAIDTGDVTRVLEPIWREKPETASRLRGRIESILDFAKTRGWRTGENPARWKGHLENTLPARAKLARVQHHAALPWSEMGAFMAKLRAEDGIGARAMEFTILTAARTGEVIGARWSEIDMAAGIWAVPAERMKAGKEHRVPLSEPALAVLRAVQPLQHERQPFVFPGRRTGAPLSDRTMLRRLARKGRTVHGFRSTFRDWCAEMTGYPRELAEAALAHTRGDKVERAYWRGDLFEKRRRLMEEWATFCGRTAPAEGEVIALWA